MMLALSNAWNRWNHSLESHTKKIVQTTSCYLPYSVKRLIDEYTTQAQLTVHGLGMSLLLQGTLGNPLIAPAVAYSLGTVSVILTSGAGYHFLKAHLQELESTAEYRLSRVVMPIFLTAFQAFALYVIFDSEHLSRPGKISLGIWTTYINGIANVFFSSFYFRRNEWPYGYDEVYLDTSDEDVLERQELLATCRSLEKEITTYRDTVKKIDGLILEFPELKALVEKYVKKHPESIVNIQKPPTDGLDPKNPIHKKAILTLTRNKWKREVRERKRFLERHPEARKCFEKCFREANPRSQENILSIEGNRR